MRGGPSRRLVGNPLGGMLRDLDRQARRTSRRSGRPAGPGGQREESGETAVPVRPAPARPGAGAAAAVVVTDETGRARWQFPRPYGRPPVLTALPVGGVPLGAVVEEATQDQAVVRLWGPTGWAGAGVELHLTARPASV